MVKPTTSAWAKENRWSPTRHGQIGQNVASGFQSVDLSTALGGSNEGGMRLANALGMPVVPEV